MKISRLSFVIALFSAFLMPSLVLADEFGTAAEAQALLTRAIAEVEADPSAAFAKFNDPKGGFRDRDLYVFCANAADGKLTAHPALVGTDLRTIKDKDGKPFGQEMYDTAATGKITSVTYVWPRPGGTTPVEKISFITKVGDQICGVGYYAQ